MSKPEQKRALIVGAGPVGSLTALSLHQRGWHVEVWEGRTDPRESTDPSNLRSINLAISARGITAIKSVDAELAKELLQEAIPMRGRMIHHLNGKREPQTYDPKEGECINSLPRPLLNLRLIERLPSDIPIHFSTKLSHIDWATQTAHAKPSTSPRSTMEYSKPGESEGSQQPPNPSAKGKTTEFDLIVGCDGSWSKVRQEMMRVEKMDFKQSFIDHEYVELHMPALHEVEEECRARQVGQGKFLMEESYLHIWPRESFMLIALPNKDGSFTLTLFSPRDTLLELTTRELARDFFRKHFQDALDWAGEERVLNDFEKNPRGGLVTINVKPSHHIASKSTACAILLGDASHSMVPFYGQGLNCGLEDVRVFNSVIDKHYVMSTKSTTGSEDALKAALKEYSTIRSGDLEAIVELAMENYTEMRSQVLSPLYHLRRVLDSILSFALPPTSKKAILSESGDKVKILNTEPFPTPHVSGWSSLYSMVTFRPDVSYKEALRKERAQKEVVRNLGWGLGTGVGLGVVGGLAWGATVLMKRTAK